MHEQFLLWPSSFGWYMADVAEAAVKKFENAQLNETLIGSAQKSELKRYHRAESGIM